MNRIWLLQIHSTLESYDRDGKGWDFLDTVNNTQGSGSYEKVSEMHLRRRRRRRRRIWVLSWLSSSYGQPWISCDEPLSTPNPTSNLTQPPLSPWNMLVVWLVVPLLPHLKCLLFIWLTFSATLFLFAAWKGGANSKWLTPQGHKTWDKKGAYGDYYGGPLPNYNQHQGRTTTTTTTTTWDNNNSSQLSSTPSTARLSQEPTTGLGDEATQFCVLSHKHSLPLNLSIPSWMHILKTHCRVLRIWQGIINLCHYHFTKLIHSHFTCFICCR